MLSRQRVYVQTRTLDGASKVAHSSILFVFMGFFIDARTRTARKLTANGGRASAERYQCGQYTEQDHCCDRHSEQGIAGEGKIRRRLVVVGSRFHAHC